MAPRTRHPGRSRKKAQAPVKRPASASASGPAQVLAGTAVYRAVRGPWLLHLGLCLLLVAASCLLYQGDLGLGFFLLDDPTYVITNPWIKDFTAENIRFILTTPYFANFSPLHLLSYMLDHQAAGLNPRAFHLSSNLWAGAVAAGVYILGLVLLPPSPLPKPSPAPPREHGARSVLGALLQQRRPEMFAFLGALLFLAHPVHVEAVAWISSRKDLVATAFAVPAMLAYFNYRQDRPGKGWYVVSLIAFALAVAGKLSVLVVPGVLLVFDLLVEHRRGWGLFLDKIPFGLISLLFIWPTLGAQPPTGVDWDFFVVGHSVLLNLWLLTGFGSYVMARPGPDPAAGVVLKTVWVLLPLSLAVLPLLLRRRIPGMASALFYWTLLAMIPPQVLRFVHPVTDRYLFFPSIAVVLLLAWTGLWLSERLGRPAQITLPLALSALVLLWAQSTLAYLAEWRDPRSVWFAACAKSSDPLVHQYLGSHYQDAADHLPALLAGDTDTQSAAVALAQTVWNGDERLEPLLREWNSPTQTRGPLTPAYQSRLRQLALEQYEKALLLQKDTLAPNLHFRIGKVALDNKQFDQARQAFRRAQEQALQSSHREARQELTVRCWHALALIEWEARHYDQALALLRQAEEEQQRSGQTYLPELPQQREQLENLLRSR